jgi:hypothetical protein
MEKLSEHLIGEEVLIRSNMSGVHFGTLLGVSNNNVRLRDSRRLYTWGTGGRGLSLSEVAVHGIAHEDSKVTEVLPDIVIGDVCEIIPCSGMAHATIMGAAVAKP